MQDVANGLTNMQRPGSKFNLCRDGEKWFSWKNSVSIAMTRALATWCTSRVKRLGAVNPLVHGEAETDKAYFQVATTAIALAMLMG